MAVMSIQRTGLFISLYVVLQLGSFLWTNVVHTTPSDLALRDLILSSEFAYASHETTTAAC